MLALLTVPSGQIADIRSTEQDFEKVRLNKPIRQIMNVKRLSKTGEFVAIDEIGNSVLVIEYTEVVGVDTLDGGPTEKPGLKHYMTATTEKVNANRDGSYIVVGKNTLLRRPE